MRRLERRHLESFIAVAEAGSIAAAADRLYLSPSAVSKSISQLEEILGLTLFARRAKGLELLSPAEKLLSPSRIAISAVQAIEEGTASSYDGEFRENLHIVCTYSLASDPLSGIITEYLRNHSDNRLFIDTPREVELNSIVDLVMAGHYDVGITEMPPTEIPGLVTHQMVDAETWAVLPPGTGVAKDGEITIDQLIEVGLIVGPLWESSEVSHRLSTLAPQIRRAITVRTPHRGMFLQFAIAGLGAVLLGTSQARLAATAGCVVGRVRGLPPRKLAVIHHHLSKGLHIRRFVEACQRYDPS